MRVFSTFVSLMLLCSIALAGSHWEFNQVDPLGPGNRIGAGIAYDSNREVLVYTGHHKEIHGLWHDVWEYSNSGWRLADTGYTQIAKRGKGSFCYDATRQNCVWFGGWGNGMLEDTLTWDGSHWTTMSPSTHPPLNSYNQPWPMVYDSARQVCVLVTTSETWEWDGAQWTQIPVVPLMGVIQGSVMSFDETRNVSVLYTEDSGDTTFAEFDGTNWTMSPVYMGIPFRNDPVMFFMIQA